MPKIFRHAFCINACLGIIMFFGILSKPRPYAALRQSYNLTMMLFIHTLPMVAMFEALRRRKILKRLKYYKRNA